jgi:hypothetical protein
MHRWPGKQPGGNQPKNPFFVAIAGNVLKYTLADKERSQLDEEWHRAGGLTPHTSAALPLLLTFYTPQPKEPPQLGPPERGKVEIHPPNRPWREKDLHVATLAIQEG